MYFSQSGGINLIPGVGFPCDLLTAVHPYCVFTWLSSAFEGRGGVELGMGWEKGRGENEGIFNC